MALDAETAKQLVESLNRTNQLLIQAFAAAGLEPTAGASNVVTHTVSGDANTTGPQDHARPVENATASSVQTLRSAEIALSDYGSVAGASEESAWFVSHHLEEETYTEDGFREHLRTFDWTAADYKILQELAKPETLSEYLRRQPMFPQDPGPQSDRSHLTHYSIFNVGVDGSPLPIRVLPTTEPVSRSQAIWSRIKSINGESRQSSAAGGRITIVREPSPLLFAALHYTHSKHFNMEELYESLVEENTSLSRPPNPFASDDRLQRTFSFTMSYFTLIEEGCEPMDWQQVDLPANVRTHVPLCRGSSVIALSLEGAPIGQVKNKQRRSANRFGNVYHPFAPWRVLSITAFPDLMSTLDTHDTNSRYVNGPEAFLVTLCAEYKDAARRLTELSRNISGMITLPPDFIFSLDTRDKLLFEDEQFTYSRRYFWLYHTLGIVNEDISDMITAYKESFNESVWEGTNKIVWPGEAMMSAKYNNWRKRMKLLRKNFDVEINRLSEIVQMNLERMRTVKEMHNTLFQGTSVLENRRSIESSIIVLHQARNVRLLTVCAIVFLPLIFVASIFGMVDMPKHESLHPFAWVTVAVCIPTYFVLGLLSTSFATERYHRAISVLISEVGFVLAYLLDLLNYRPNWTNKYHQHDAEVQLESRQANVRRTSMDFAPRGTFQGMPTLFQNSDTSTNRNPLPFPAARFTTQSGDRIGPKGPKFNLVTTPGLDAQVGTSTSMPNNTSANEGNSNHQSTTDIRGQQLAENDNNSTISDHSRRASINSASQRGILQRIFKGPSRRNSKKDDEFP